MFSKGEIRYLFKAATIWDQAGSLIMSLQRDWEAEQVRMVCLIVALVSEVVARMEGNSSSTISHICTEV